MISVNSLTLPACFGRVPGSNLGVGISCSSWGVSRLTRLLLANAGAGLQIVNPFQLNPLNPLNQPIQYCIRIDAV
jgi:hypothetical protein